MKTRLKITDKIATIDLTQMSGEPLATWQEAFSREKLNPDYVYDNITVSGEGGYGGYDSIDIYGVRDETDAEALAREARIAAVHARVAKVTEKRRRLAKASVPDFDDAEFDQLLKLKEKYE